jgi:hypothetical protein
VEEEAETNLAGGSQNRSSLARGANRNLTKQRHKFASPVGVMTGPIALAAETLRLGEGQSKLPRPSFPLPWWQQFADLRNCLIDLI